MDKLKQVTHIDNVRLGEDERSVVILDQTQLPNRTEYKTLRTPEEMFEAIQSLRVRGAPAIGICAGYCIYALARQGTETTPPLPPGSTPRRNISTPPAPRRST